MVANAASTHAGHGLEPEAKRMQVCDPASSPDNAAGGVADDMAKDMANDRAQDTANDRLPKSSASQAQGPPTAAASNVDRLQALLAVYYPQCTRVQYMPVRAGTPGDSLPRLLDAAEPARYRCRILVFDMLLESRDLHPSIEEAQEAVARMAVELLTEFSAVIRDRSSDSRFGRLLEPLIREMAGKLARPPLEPGELEKLAMGLPAVQSIERFKEVESFASQAAVLSPILAAIFEKQSAASVLAPGATGPSSPPVGAPAAQPPKAEAGHAAEELLDPLTVVHEHCQKKGGALAPPAFDVFIGKTVQIFGCRASYDGKDYITEAIYKTKKDAKRAAATLICEALFGTSCPMARVKPEIAPRATPQDVVFAKSHDPSSFTTYDARAARPAQPVGRIEPAASRLAAVPPAGKRFVSILNELYQVTRLGQPEYQFQTGDTIGSYYVCYLPSRFDAVFLEELDAHLVHERLPLQFVSQAFTKKTDAKEDCAARAVLFLQAHGLIDDQGRARRRMVPAPRPGDQGYGPHGSPAASPQASHAPYGAPMQPVLPPLQAGRFGPVPPPPFPLPMGMPGALGARFAPMLPLMRPPAMLDPARRPPMPGALPQAMFPVLFGVPPPLSQQAPRPDQPPGAAPSKATDPRLRVGGMIVPF